MKHVHHGKLTDLNAAIPDGVVDVLLCSASFEERCLSVPTSLNRDRVGLAIVAVNQTYWGAVKESTLKLESLFDGKHRRMTLDALDPIVTADSIAQVVFSSLVGEPKRILLDITAFTRESLLILLAFLRARMRPGDDLSFVYAHAKEYSVGDPPELKWLSKGVMEIRSVLAFPGVMVPSRRTHMIILVGFEDDRALEIIRESEPSFISLGVGDARDAGTEPHQTTNVHRFKKMRSILGPVQEFVFQAYDPELTVAAIRTQAAKFPDCNVVLAPMNTKISTVGAAIFAFEDYSVQICYAPALIYNVDNYSKPDQDYYLFKIPGFGFDADSPSPNQE